MLTVIVATLFVALASFLAALIGVLLLKRVGARE